MHQLFSKLVVTIILLSSVLGVTSGAFAQLSSEKITFDDHIRPLLAQRCSTCHNGDRREGDLDVTNYVNLMDGGGAGTVLEPKDAEGSYLFALVTHADSPEMPPSGSKLPDEELKLIAAWINGGLLENSGSAPAKPSAKPVVAIAAPTLKRPAVQPLPARISLEPAFVPTKASIAAIAANPWAPVIAVSTPKQILLFRTDKMALAGILPIDGVARALQFSRNGKLLIAGRGVDGASGNALLFDAITGERIASLGRQADTVLAADISADHSRIAIGGPKRVVDLIGIDGSLIATLTKHTEWVTAIRFSPDGKLLATGDRNGGLYIWEADTGMALMKLDGHNKTITAVDWRSDSRQLATSSEDGNVRLWSPDQSKQTKSWSAHKSGCSAVAFRRNGMLITSGRDRLVKLWDANGKTSKTLPGLKDIVTVVAFCDETNQVFAADWTGELRVWDAKDGKPTGTLSAIVPLLGDRLKQDQESLASLLEKQKNASKSLAELQAALAKQQSTLDSITQQVDVAKGMVARWQSEIEFDREVKRLRSEVAKAQAIAETLQLESDNAKQRAAKAAKVAGQMQRRADASAAALSEIEKKLDRMRGLKAK